MFRRIRELLFFRVQKLVKVFAPGFYVVRFFEGFVWVSLGFVQGLSLLCFRMQLFSFRMQFSIFFEYNGLICEHNSLVSEHKSEFRNPTVTNIILSWGPLA